VNRPLKTLLEFQYSILTDEVSSTRGQICSYFIRMLWVQSPGRSKEDSSSSLLGDNALAMEHYVADGFRSLHQWYILRETGFYVVSFLQNSCSFMHQSGGLVIDYRSHCKFSSTKNTLGT
jgi:hypothetical protein